MSNDNTTTAQNEDTDNGQVADQAQATEDSSTEGNDTADTADEAKAEEKPKRVVRRKPAAKAGKAAGDIPETDDEPAPKRRGRKAAEPEDTGETRQTGSFDALKAELRNAGRFPKYLRDTTQVTKRLSDLREDPVVAGSEVNPRLIFKAERWEQFEAKVNRACDMPVAKDHKAVIFAGTDKQGNLDWLVGTKGDDLVRLRESKSGAITTSRVKLADVEKFYNLGFFFDDATFEYWQVDLEKVPQQYNLGKKKALALKAAADKRAKKAAAEKAEQNPEAAKSNTAPAEPKKTVRVKRKAVASK
jgi:hypothetical protein